MALTYSHVRAHQDALKPWSILTLEEQLNVICDELANAAVQRYLSGATPTGREIQLLPLEKVAIVIKGEKLTTDAGQEVWYAHWTGRGKEILHSDERIYKHRRVRMDAIQVRSSLLEIYQRYLKNQAGHVTDMACQTMHWHLRHPILNGLHPRHPGQQVPKLPTGEGNKPTPEPLPRPWTNPSFSREY